MKKYLSCLIAIIVSISAIGCGSANLELSNADYELSNNTTSKGIAIGSSSDDFINAYDGFVANVWYADDSSNTVKEIDVNKVPYIDGALEMAKMGLVPAGTYNNKDYISGDVESINIEECYLDLMYDPQTSGGLLITLAESEVENIMKDLENKNMDTKVAVIGRVLEKQEKSIVLKNL